MLDETINGDLDAHVAIATSSLRWSPSPSPRVWRKRLHRVGPQESGQVTSVVRYDANSDFPAHDHPDGEEILVLDGIFTDDRGDWPAGTYLLNPEGYRHAPSSRDGCVLFVKLRQYPGLDREKVALDTNAMAWESSVKPGVDIKRLYAQPGYSDSMTLERWAEGTAPGQRSYPEGAEVFVLDGAFSDESGEHAEGSWIRFPTGAGHAPRTDTGCTLYIKRGGFRYLRRE